MVIGPTELALGLRECGGANSRSNTVWMSLGCKKFQRVWRTSCHLKIVFDLPYLKLLHNNYVIFNIVV